MSRRLMHWRSTEQIADGAACGRLGVAFTARVEDVTCRGCRRHIERAGVADGGQHG